MLGLREHCSLGRTGMNTECASNITDGEHGAGWYDMHGNTHLDSTASMNNNAHDTDDIHDLASPTFLEARTTDLQEGKDSHVRVEFSYGNALLRHDTLGHGQSSCAWLEHDARSTLMTET